MKALSAHALTLATSQTVAITTQAAQLRAEGKDIISLSAGEPDFETPLHIKQAAIDAITAGYTRYTPATGINALKQAICDDFNHSWGVSYDPSQIAVTNGGKHALSQAILALCNPGDEVIIPAPYWVTYPEVIKFTGATAVLIPTTADSGFRISPEQLEQALTAQTKLIIFNSPSNPTGAVYSKNELDALVAVIEKHDVWVLTDEIYARLVYDTATHISLASYESIKDKVLVVNGVSKAYAMTGWRIGWLCSPPEIAPLITKIQSQLTHHPCSIAQYAALAALKGEDTFMSAWLQEFDRRRKYVTNRLNAMPGITCRLPEGAFYVFPHMASYIGKSFEGMLIDSSTVFCEVLLHQGNVAFVPGVAFGAEGYFRISYAASLEQLHQAMDRLENTLAKIE